MPLQQERGPGSAAALALGDTALCALLIEISCRLVHRTNPAWPAGANFAPLPIAIAFLALVGNYRRIPATWSREYTTIVTATALGFSAGGAIAVLRGGGETITAPFVLAWLLTLLALLLVRLWRRSAMAASLAQEKLPVVILGTPACTRSVYRALANRERAERTEEPGVRVAGIFADGAEEWPEVKGHDVVVGAAQWAKSFAECCAIQHAIVAIPAECDAATEELFAKSAQNFRHLFAAPQIARHETTRANRGLDGRDLTLHAGPSFSQREAGPLKRLVDVLGALTLGLLSLPFLVAAAVAIRLNSPGPVLYKQVRVGKGNRAFTTLKFRTMYSNASERLHEYLGKDAGLQAEWTSVHKLREDPRVTFVGRFLRRFSLDELPQLWNVLVGDMSLVGPRPIVVREIEKYGSKYAAYERARPGLTGLWQVSGRNDTTYDERVDYDSFYVRNWSLWLDARIIARTLRAVISGAGAY